MITVERIEKELFEKGFSESKKVCLKHAEKLKELAEKVFITKILTKEEMENYISEYINFESKIYGNKILEKYNNKREMTFGNINIEVEKNIANLHSMAYIDGNMFCNFYVSVNI